jgi:hypothetical protein
MSRRRRRGQCAAAVECAALAHSPIRGPPHRYTFDKADGAVCTECCNGVVPAGKIFFGVNASTLCECGDHALTWHAEHPLIYDVVADPFESKPLDASNWPANASVSYDHVVKAANATRDAMEESVHPKPQPGGGGTCTGGYPSVSRQACCEGCHQPLLGGKCVHDREDLGGRECTCKP